MTTVNPLPNISESGVRPGFDRKMTNPEIAELPMRAYQGEILVVSKESQMKSAMELLKGDSVLGFDTETKPAYRKGEVYPPALIQLCSSKGACVFQIQKLGIPDPLLEIMADREIIKAGIAPDRDVEELAEEAHFIPDGFIDLGRISHRSGMKNHGLRGLAGVLLGLRISKKAQRSNWARHNLTPEQIRYAATDAWVGREIYLAMQNLKYV